MHKPSFYCLIQQTSGRSQKYIRTADARRIVRGLENSASASLLVYSDYALHMQRPTDACNKTGTHRGYSCICPKLSRTASPQTKNRERNQDKFQFLSANMIALVGTVLYNAIKEYYDDGTRKTIYFHSYTVEDNYNAICEKQPSRQRQDYNRAGKREDNILTVDECRTGHSNEEDIEADEREEETRVRLRESSGEIHDILLREFRRANDFTESFQNKGKGWSIMTDSTWDKFAMLAEEYTIDNCIELELEDCDALVERYEEEINCSDLYSTV
ncbi:hypothetical protein HBI31_115240 [Parastagonospora nodorum]|nr:hypothetical protein HBI31_115240 [Parastagonospora nodorum]